jgi:hypothetical protein
MAKLEQVSAANWMAADNVAFDGDFEMLPFRAHVLYGDVPLYPISEDFHLAVSVAFGRDDAAADWRVEAVRWRLAHMGKPLNEGLREIAAATAARLYRKSVDAG